MPYRDLRDYITELQRRDLLHVVDEPVCKDTELVPLVRPQLRGLPELRRAFWFRKVTDQRGQDFDASVVLGSLGCSRAVYAVPSGSKRTASAHGGPMPRRITRRRSSSRRARRPARKSS